MPKSTLPGIKAQHAIITPQCRENHTYSGAFEIAVERLRREYNMVMDNEANAKAHIHLALTVERKND